MSRATGVGVHAGWALTFHAESGTAAVGAEVLAPVTSDRYDGSVEVSLPGGLEGGSCTVTVEGLLDADHLTLAGRAPRSTVMRVYLFWYDTGGVGGYLANLASLTEIGGSSLTTALQDRLVAELTVVQVRRIAGAKRYETVLTARERVFERMSEKVRRSVCVESPRTAVDIAAEQTGVAVRYEQGFTEAGQLDASATSDVGTAMTTFTRGATWRREVGDVATALEKASGHFGRGMLLIRDGALHVGFRAGRLGGGIPVELTPSGGLVEVGGLDGRARTLVLKGRADLKPGELVVFDLPPTEGTPSVAAAVGQAIAGSLGAVGPVLPTLTDQITSPQLLYVESVAHRLSRTAGFVTTLTGVQVPGGAATDAAQLYDRPPESGPEEEPARSSADAAERAALAVRRGLSEAVAGLRFLEGGEVRAATAEGAGSAEEPPSRTATVWRGLADPDGHPNRLARLPVVREEPDVRQRVPHVSPFAWGRTGLVVPRYPGTRVVLGHARGAGDDPVDLGAVWESGTGPDAEPGDWWLILPVGVAEAQRSALADTAEPGPHTGSVTQDLIDADGNRVIEVGELTIRITRDALASAGTRPKRAGEDGGEADAVTIEHVDAGSSIVMTSDGTIRITGSKIELDAGSGEISLTAGNVNVSVTDAMDVS